MMGVKAERAGEERILDIRPILVKTKNHPR
jgi:hypothetical protein